MKSIRSLAAILGTASLLAACGPALSSPSVAVRTTTSFTFRELKSVRLPPLIAVHESPPPIPGDVAYFSPNGNLFALSLNITNGTAEIGSVHPFALHRVRLGQGVRVVGLTGGYLIGSDWKSGRDYIFPLGPGGALGKPFVWQASRDLWQNWVSTSQGIALETGGYESGSLSLTLRDGNNVALDGGEMYLSPDRRWGLVTMRSRERWTGSPAQPYELQGADSTSPLAIWHLTAQGRPTRTALLHLPPSPKALAKDQLITLGIAFAPDDRYVAIQLWTATGPMLQGVIYVYSVQGRLVGTLPYGNGFSWLPGGDELLVRTPYREGKGKDRIMDVHARTIASWPDAVAQAFLAASPRSILALRDDQMGTISGGRFTPVKGLPHAMGVVWARWSPSGRSAIVELTGKSGKTESVWLVTQD